MTTFLIEAPFPTFSDTNGKPLDNGKIWIGTVDLNPKQYPAQVWWDEAMTIPAVQPIRTSGGYPVRDGTPSRIYTGAVFSITVENRQGAVVYSALNGTTTTAINTGWGGQTFTADGREGPYPLDYITPDPRAMALVLDGVWQEYETDYNFVIMPSAPSGYGVQIVGYPAPVDPIRIRVLFTADVAGTGASINGDIAQFGTRQALVDFMAASGVVFPGFAVMAAGLIYKGEALATELPGLPGLVPVDATPGHYGAVGDGVTNDAAALAAAWASGREIDHGSATYAFASTITATLPRIRWVSSGARLLYTGAVAATSVVLTVPINSTATLTGSGLTFDAGGAAFAAVEFASSATELDAESTWPQLAMDGLKARNWFRASTAFSGGDGIRIRGGWGKVFGESWDARDGFMAVGAGISGSQGIFGITIGSGTSTKLTPIRIELTNYYVENVWSLDPTVFYDQDAVRIFQYMPNPQVSAKLLNGTVINVTGRAIKLHSGPNAIVDGLHRVLDNAVVPQSGLYGPPDIDAQQAPATITNCRFFYDGIWHSSFVRNYTDRGAFHYGGANTSNISWNLQNCAGNTIIAVTQSSLGGDVDSDGPDSNVRSTVSGLSGTGAILQFLTVNVDGAGFNGVAFSNAVGELTGNAVTVAGADTSTLKVVCNNIINVGADVPFAVVTDGRPLWDVSSGFVFGFTGASMSSDAVFGRPLTVDQGTAGGVIASFRGNNPRVELYDSIGPLSTGVFAQIEGGTRYYADYYGTAAGASFHDFRMNGTELGNRALVLDGSDYSAQFYGRINTTVGSVGNPAIRSSDDPDTGIYFPALDQFGVSTGGVRRLGIDNAAVTIYEPIVVDQGTAGGVIASFKGNNPRIELYDSIGTLSSGMIGQADGATLYYADYFGTAAGVSSHDFRLNGTGSGNRALVISGADYSSTFFGPIVAAAGAVGLPGVAFTSDLTSGLYRIGLGQIGVATGGTRRMTINSTGTFLTPPGAYANDAGAAAGGVAIGELYRVTGGTVAWRQV